MKSDSCSTSNSPPDSRAEVAKTCHRMLVLTRMVIGVLLALFGGMATFAMRDPVGLASFGVFGLVETQSAPSTTGRLLLVTFIFSLGAIAIAALFNLAHAFKELSSHKGISQKAAQYIERCGKLFLLSVILAVLFQMPTSAILTWNNPLGERTISITFGSVHLLAIVCGGAFLALAGVLRRASELNDEMKFVV